VPRIPGTPHRLSATGARDDGAPRPYHHGDLRRALVDASLTILRTQGPEALTLRAAARAAGVSQTAPYRHFADRAALVAGVAEDGFRRLHARLVAVATAPPAPGSTERAGLQRLAVEYLRFALEHPAEYRIMFGGELAAWRGAGAASGGAPEASPNASADSFAEARGRVFALLRGGIARLQAVGLVRGGDPATMALSAWALVHGVAMLALDGQVARAGAASPEELALAATELMMFGMAPGARAAVPDAPDEGGSGAG
jgi:AcrR family transcriptional regulator